MYEYRYLYIYLFIFEIQSQLQLVTAIIVYVVNSDACFKRFVCLLITFIYAYFALFDVLMCKSQYNAISNRPMRYSWPSFGYEM